MRASNAVKPDSAQLLDELYDDPDTRPVCTSEQNGMNALATRYMTNLIPKARAITAAASNIGDDSRDMGAMDRVVSDNRLDWDFDYFQCDPSYLTLKSAYNSFVSVANESQRAKQRAYLKFFENFQRETGILENILRELRSARQVFETTDAGGEGVAAIERAREQFEKQVAILKSFVLHDFTTIERKLYSAAEYKSKANATITEGYDISVITNLDRLRDEYVKLGRPVPRPGKFTTTKSSRRYTFKELNTGDYDWAILTDTLLAKIDAIADAIEGKGYKVQLNSVYRNPARAKGLSQHQFGTAVDFQVFDFNGSGGERDKEDWKILRAITDKFSPVYTEPIEESGEGHVHVDWRNLD